MDMGFTVLGILPFAASSGAIVGPICLPKATLTMGQNLSSITTLETGRREYMAWQILFAPLLHILIAVDL
jgi:hypothetical protein